MEKYLRQYAEPETKALKSLIDALGDRERWANVMVIPACNETAGLLRPPPRCSGRSLLILVINENMTAPEYVSAANQLLATAACSKFSPLWESTGNFDGFGLGLLQDPLAARDILLVDRFSEGRKLPARGGVGHARKIGCDLAAGLFHRERIQSSWIHCTDADVHLPDSYFQCSDRQENRSREYAALVYPFRHVGGRETADQGDVNRATQLYELSLRYYVAGMKFARSPYAFHTIGSTLAVDAHHYAKVRGFPRREAGEDFYLLNKLAKVGRVLELEQLPGCEAIEIAARRSDRVPFGTGAAVNAITALANPVTDFRFYNPAVFELLRQWLQSWPAIWQSRSDELDLIQQPLLTALENLGAQQALQHAFSHSSDPDQFTRQMHTWFDAFRTLKLIHALRDCHFPSVTLNRLRADQSYQRLLEQNQELRAFDRKICHKA